MSSSIIKWPNPDCQALKSLGAKHDWCIPLNTLNKLPTNLYTEVLRVLGRLDITEYCWEFECSSDGIVCRGFGLYACARDRELRPLILRILKFLGLA